MSMNVFNSSGTAFLGPQPFAFDRAAMLAGQPATFITPGITGGAREDAYLPADLDGSTLPPAGAPNTFVEWPGTPATYRIYHFHVGLRHAGQLDLHAVRHAAPRRLSRSSARPRAPACRSSGGDATSTPSATG